MDSFDFIVIGAGSAGCAAAARLSEKSSVSVLLVEAGEEGGHWHVRMPLAVDQLLNGARFNWRYSTEPEPGLAGRILDHPRGKVMGGSSGINGMVYTRGNPQDYDDWRDVHGCDGWGYADVLPYFKRMEAAPEGRDSQFRGKNGPMRIGIPDVSKNPLNQAFLRAGEESGFPGTQDSNGAQHEGFGPIEQTIWKGERFTTAKGYLTPEVRQRPNLTILSKACVLRVILDKRRVIGVEFRDRSGTRTVSCRKEVVLCAGAVGSPQILMLSGIGPRDHLAEQGIVCRHDLPGVGQNLQDHPDITVQYACQEPVSLLRFTRWPKKAFVGMNWFLAKGGPAASNQFEVGAYLRTRPGLSKPNLKLEFFPLAISHETLKPYVMDAFQIHLTLQNSPARGFLRLRSARPDDKPRLVMNYLQNEEDFQTFREGVEITRRIVRAPAFDRYRGAELSPGLSRSEGEAFKEWVRAHLNTAYHLSCTCSMGGKNNPAAVVSPQLAVHGIDGLRVADASVMPHVVSANTNATAIMIGERVADFCLGKQLPRDPSASNWIKPEWEPELLTA